MAVITGNENNNVIFGTEGDDLISGLGGDDQLVGQGGDDTLLGGPGIDALSGGLGNDLLDGGGGFTNSAVFYDGEALAGPGVTVSLQLQGQAQNTGQGLDTLIDIDTLYGTRRADTLIGDDGNNGLIGAGGDDSLSAGLGDDLVVVSGGDVVADGGAGQDLLRFWHSLGPPVLEETPNGVNVSLTLQGAPQDTGAGLMTLTGFEHLSGSRYGDTLTGDDGVNHIGGSLGDDLIQGGGGGDSLMGDAHFFVVQGGWVGDSAGSDTLVGGAGDDTLFGGGGDDVLTGGEGADVFRFTSLTGGSDLITDLDKHPHRGDVIDLSAIDANALVDGDQAFVLAKKDLTGQAGEAAMVYDKDTGRTLLKLDVDGDAVADLTIEIVGKFQNFDSFVL